jgi:hypothetical protein
MHIIAPQTLQNAAALLEHIRGTYCICKHRFFFFFGYLLFLCMTFVWECGLQYATENILVIGNCLLHTHVSIFNTFSTPVREINKMAVPGIVLASWINVLLVCVNVLKERLIQGIGGHFGYTTKPWPSAVINKAELSSMHNRGEQNGSKPRYTGCNIYIYMSFGFLTLRLLD